MGETVDPQTDLEPLSDEEIPAATVEVVATLEHYRELHRQADTKAGLCLTVVGLIVAAATAVLPRLEGWALGFAVVALAVVVLGGVCFGASLYPAELDPSPESAEKVTFDAVRRSRDPYYALEHHLSALVRTEKFVNAKHFFIRSGINLLGIGFVLAVAATIAAALPG